MRVDFMWWIDGLIWQYTKNRKAIRPYKTNLNSLCCYASIISLMAYNGKLVSQSSFLKSDIEVLIALAGLYF